MEGAGSSLAGLPCEVIEEILLSPSLSVQDICRMRQVCWHIHSIVARLWTKIATSRSVFISCSDNVITMTSFECFKVEGMGLDLRLHPRGMVCSVLPAMSV